MESARGEQPLPRPGHRPPRVLACAVVLATLFTFAAAAVAHAGSGSPQPPRRYRATLVPRDRIPVAAPVDGIVAGYLAAEGAAVAAGAVLFEFDAVDATFDLQIARAELAEASAFVEQTGREWVAVQQLLQAESAKRVEVERAESQRAIAVARHEKAAVRVARCIWRVEAHRVTAPSRGVLVARRKVPGQGVRAFETVCELVDVERVLAVIQVPVPELAALAIGRQVAFEPGEGPAIQGKCVEVGTEINPGANTVQVKIELPNEGGRLRPGGVGEIVLEAP